MTLSINSLIRCIGVMSSLALVSCTHHYDTAPGDPIEPVNRITYHFNRGLDHLYIKPVAQLYYHVLPEPVRASMGHAFANVGEVPTFANLFIQGKGDEAATTLARFAINSALGVVGLFDVASEMGLNRYKEDFGLTLGKWGWSESSYFVIPMLGPSTVRDTAGMLVNSYVTPQTYLKPKARNTYYAANLIQRRSELFDTEEVLDAAGVDEYALVRESYLQRRSYLMGQSSTDTSREFLTEPPE